MTDADTVKWINTGRRHVAPPNQIGEYRLELHGRQETARVVVCEACWSVEAHFFEVGKGSEGDDDCIRVTYRILNRGAGPCEAVQ